MLEVSRLPICYCGRVRHIPHHTPERPLAISHTLGKARNYLRTHGVAATAAEAARRAARRASMGDVPASVHVEISNICNLHCEYCILDQAAQGEKVMSESTFAALLPYLRGASRIDVSGIAEPLMNTRWPEMVRAVRKAAPRAHIAMCSNATLLTRKKSRTLVESTLDELVFSLDGVEPGVIDDIRKGGSLSSMLDNVRTLQDVKRELGRANPELNVTVVIQRATVEQLPDTIRLAAELGVASVAVNGLEPYSEDVVDEPVWTDPDMASYLPGILARAERVADETGVTVRLPWMTPLMPAVCPQVHRPMVLADGAVVPCSVLAYERPSLLRITEGGDVVRHDDLTPRVSFGSVKERDLKEIWTSAEYRSFRHRVTSGAFPRACNTCLLKHGVICPTPPLSFAECLRTVPRHTEV